MMAEAELDVNGWNVVIGLADGAEVIAPLPGRR